MQALGIDWFGLLWQAVAFGLLVFLLRRFLYKPTLAAIDERAARVRRGMEDAERARRRAEDAQQEFDQVITEARRRGQETVGEAARAGEKVREEIIEQARQDAARIVQDGRQQVEIEQRQALASVRNDIVDLSIEAARRVLQQELDEKKQRRLVEQFLSEPGSGNEG
jgi:F-type H+-transporting ATPase subunit b